MTDLVNNLGGPDGFGTSNLGRNDDGFTGRIDLTSVFGSQGINFFGHYYTGLYINNNGSLTFNSGTSAFTPTAITGSTSNPIIAPYWADVDTRGGAVSPTPGGTSTGSNLVWWALDSTTHTFTATWDDVGYYGSHTDKLDAFQVSLHEIDTQGDFEITFRYEAINWTTGDASGGHNGLGGTVARAGFSAGNGTNFYELPQSGNQAGMLALPTTSNVGTPGTYVFEVLNGSPTAAISVGNASIVQGSSGLSYVSVPVTLTQPASATVTVQYVTQDGTAIHDHDYIAQSGTLTFAPGLTQQNILIAVIGEVAIEPDETFTVNLSNPSTSSTIHTATGTVTIENDTPVLSIAATDADKLGPQAGSTPFTFTVTRTGDTSQPISVNWAVSGIDTDDFQGGTLPSGTVTLGVGETSTVITIHVAGETIVEPDEPFTVTLSNQSTGALIGTASAQGVIRNSTASLSIAATDADKLESPTTSTPFTFTVTRSGYTGSALTATWAVSGGDTDDFVGGVLPSGTVSFAAGETSKVITVNVAPDTAVEPDEPFTVTLSNPSTGAVIGGASAQGVIRNANASLAIAATDADKLEGDNGATAFTFTVTRTGYTGSALTADWTVSGGQVNGSDFLPDPSLLPAAGFFSLMSSFLGRFFPDFAIFQDLPSGQVSFAAGETSKTITVYVLGDTMVEDDESFTVTLSNPGDGAVIGTASATGTIRNDDTAPPSSNGPMLSWQGAPVTPGQFGPWAPVAVTPAGGGLEVAWRLGHTNQYSVWNTDLAGNMLTNPTGVVSGSSYALQALEGTFRQDVNGDGTIGLHVATIEQAGATALVQVADRYALGGASGPQIKFGGAPVTVDQFGAWAPVAAEAIAGGYEVAWKSGADQYSVWNTDLAGNMLSNPTGVVSGSSYALESLEGSFHQDLNGDGTIGVVTTTIEQAGATALVQVANTYALGDASGPSIKFGSAPVTVGQFGNWAPVAAEAIDGGYEVAWKSGADQYSVWRTDSDGNMLSNPTGVVSGESYALQSMEPSFQQDLNGDGMIGPLKTLIESSGSTALVQLADTYVLGGAPGPQIKFNGAPVTAGQFGDWAPIAAEAIDGGYEVAWKSGADQYSVWQTDLAGNMLSNPTGVVSGSSSAVQMFEPSFQQDLNGDGTIGSTAATLQVFGQAVASSLVADGPADSGQTIGLAVMAPPVQSDVLANPRG